MAACPERSGPAIGSGRQRHGGNAAAGTTAGHVPLALAMRDEDALIIY